MSTSSTLMADSAETQLLYKIIEEAPKSWPYLPSTEINIVSQDGTVHSSYKCTIYDKQILATKFIKSLRRSPREDILRAITHVLARDAEAYNGPVPHMVEVQVKKTDMREAEVRVLFDLGYAVDRVSDPEVYRISLMI